MRRLGRDTRGFPSPDRVLSDLDKYSKQYGRGLDLTRPNTIATGKVVHSGSGFSRRVAPQSAFVPAFEGSLTFPEVYAMSSSERLPKSLDEDLDIVTSTRNIIDISNLGKISEYPQPRDIPGFSESLSRVRQHLRSPQMQNVIESVHRNTPEERPGGRFVRVRTHDRNTLPSDDYIDLQTQNWAEMSPDTWFPDNGR